MYRFFYLLALLLGISLCLYVGATWWAPAVVAAVLTLLFPVWRRSGFWFAFLAGAIVWGIYCGYLHLDSEGRLSDRLAVTFGLESGWGLVGVTALWGGITTGLGGWFGASLRRIRDRNTDRVVTDK